MFWLIAFLILGIAIGLGLGYILYKPTNNSSEYNQISKNKKICEEVTKLKKQHEEILHEIEILKETNKNNKSKLDPTYPTYSDKV